MLLGPPADGIWAGLVSGGGGGGGAGGGCGVGCGVGAGGNSLSSFTLALLLSFSRSLSSL